VRRVIVLLVALAIFVAMMSLMSPTSFAQVIVPGEACGQSGQHPGHGPQISLGGFAGCIVAEGLQNK
jgi:hypothetical protein